MQKRGKAVFYNVCFSVLNILQKEQKKRVGNGTHFVVFRCRKKSVFVEKIAPNDNSCKVLQIVAKNRF